jgi:sulfite exporter TauE/SafE
MAGNLTRMHAAQLVLQLVAALFMVVLGLYVAGWWNGLLRVERIGGRLIWQRLQPLGRRLLPVQSPARAFQLGLLWGWLPCGLVYSVLIWSVAAGSALHGAALMLSFGLGTLPTLLAMGTFAAALTVWVRRPAVRRAAGGLIIALALMQMYAVWRSVAAA